VSDGAKGPSTGVQVKGRLVSRDSDVRMMGGNPTFSARLPVPRPALVATLLGALSSLALAPILAGGGSHVPSVAAGEPPKPRGLSSLLYAGRVSAALGARDPAYAVRASAGGFDAVNPRQHLRAHFGASGIQIGSGATGVGLALRTAGFGPSTRPVDEARPRASANRVSYARGDLVEWYANGPLGIEQGFTVNRAPSGHLPGPLRLSVEVSKAVHAKFDRAGQSIVLERAGQPPIRYGDLVVTDSREHTLPSRLQLHGSKILLSVDAHGADYPLQIDPLIQEDAKLSAGEEGGEELFGLSVAVSADGNTALIGSSASEAAGAAWVFSRSGKTWTQQGGPLTGGEESGNGRFGRSVALSADGSTALIGATRDERGRGAAWVFTRSGGSWTQQGPKLTDVGRGTGKGHFGRAVALSADGNRALIGSPLAYQSSGAAWLFTRSGTTWMQEGEPLTNGEPALPTRFGVSVALSASGDTALVGGPLDGHGVGAAWAFTSSGTTWTQQGGKLTGAGEIEEGRFGASLALSADGDTALIGGPSDDAKRGATWTFTRSGGAWSQQGAKLTAESESGESKFGSATALSADGDQALIGGPKYSRHLGAAWLFSRVGAIWTQQGERLAGSNETARGSFGSSVALAFDAATALVAGFRNNARVGAVWVFSGGPALTPPPSPEEVLIPPRGNSNIAQDGLSGTPGGVAGSGVLSSQAVALPPPLLGKTTNLKLLAGTVLIRLPGSLTFVPFTGVRQVPFGTIVDATRGRVSLTTARRRGGTQTMTFFAGAFRITQRRNGLVVATLTGGDFSVCPTARQRAHKARTSSTHTSGKHVVRKLWAEGHGSYSTKGNYASGAVLGTRWLTTDRCDGTLIRVATDRVAVTNLVNHRHRKVKAGHSYFAKAR
jgi:FG-GAP repeat